MPHPETKTGLIVVRTYPSPATHGIEVSCTAAITECGKWLRLFPVPYRFLPEDQKFQKYQWIRCLATKARADRRPESFRLQDDSIEVLSPPLSTANYWQARKEYVFPLRKHCLCCIKRECETNHHPTLGIFRPMRIKRLLIESASPTWTNEQLQKLRQVDLFKTSPTTELEKVPYKFQYEFVCADDSCNGHTVGCTDWEMGALWRRCRTDYGDRWEEKFRQKYEREMIEKNDTHFFVGTHHQFPNTWMIVGLFYPPRTAQTNLFNGTSES